MPHIPRPFYKTKRRTWYVEISHVQHVLGKHDGPEPVKGRNGWNPPAEIWTAYHKLMAEAVERPASEPAIRPDEHPPVVTVLDHFLDWLAKRVEEGSKAARTYSWYFDYLQSFADAIPRTLTVDQLRPLQVYQWVDSKAGWKTGRRGAMTAVQRAMNWGAKAGLLYSVGGVSPIAHLDKPAQGRREQIVSADEYKKILALVKDRAFADLLELSWETGARPAELFAVEAFFVDLERRRWVFPIRESKGRKYQRVVYLTDRAFEITKRLVERLPKGPLLRNTDGKRWTGSTVSSRFQRIRDKLGTKYSLYAIRHSWCTAALESGKLDAVTVSVLMGHRDTQMISRHYSHLAQRSDFLAEAARKAKAS